MTACVYVIAADTGPVKVGWSTTPYARLSKLRKHHCVGIEFADIRLTGFVRTIDFLMVEHMAHQALSGQWLAGEWFDCDPEETLALVLRLAQKSDPLASIVRP